MPSLLGGLWFLTTANVGYSPRSSASGHDL